MTLSVSMALILIVGGVVSTTVVPPLTGVVLLPDGVVTTTLGVIGPCVPVGRGTLTAPPAEGTGVVITVGVPPGVCDGMVVVMTVPTGTGPGTVTTTNGLLEVGVIVTVGCPGTTVSSSMVSVAVDVFPVGSVAVAVTVSCPSARELTSTPCTL